MVLGGIEASLRRFAHYDYWSDKVRGSILLDSKADILLYGNAERALVGMTHRLARGEAISSMTDLRGAVLPLNGPLEEVGNVTIIDASNVDLGSPPYANRSGEEGGAVIRLPDFDQVKKDPAAYLYASRLLHLESNPSNARALAQRHGGRDILVTPPPIPLATGDLDRVFEFPYQRQPHPSYGGAKIPAWEMIRHSITIVRGCYGGCSFCAITSHEGRVIQSRSEASILREAEEVRDKTEAFTGVISDLGGPSANMWNTSCSNPEHQKNCRRSSCLFPNICKSLKTDQTPLISLYRKTRAVPGVKKVVIASGLRYDLALKTPAYIKELAIHHVGGYLKVAPEHTEAGPLALMQKPGIDDFEKFKLLFEKFSKEAGKEQYLIPYFIAAHPGSSDEDMLNLALWLKKNGFRADQVQTFLPTPMAAASAMYHAGGNPLAPVTKEGFQPVATAKGLRQRRLHKAFLRWHDPENWPLLREALHDMGRADLIGPGKKCLVPAGAANGQNFSRPVLAGRAESLRENRSRQAWQKGPAKEISPARHGDKRKGFSAENSTDDRKVQDAGRNQRGRRSR